MKGTLIVFSMVAALIIAGCSKGGGKIDEVRAFINEVITFQKEYADELENAKDGSEVARVIRTFIDRGIRLKTRGDEHTKKYTDFQNLQSDPALADEFQKLRNENERMSKINIDITNKYLKDKEVMKAIMEMSKKMQGGM